MMRASVQIETMMPQPVTMAYRIVKDILLVVHADRAPSAEDWAGMVHMRDSYPGRLKGQLVVAPAHASIDACQRADVQAFSQRTRSRIALLTDSQHARGAATAVAWFGVAVRALTPDRI